MQLDAYEDIAGCSGTPSFLVSAAIGTKVMKLALLLNASGVHSARLGSSRTPEVAG